MSSSKTVLTATAPKNAKSRMQAANAGAGRRPDAAAAKFWIVVGSLWFVLFFYCMISWVTGPDFAPVTFGRDKAPVNYVHMLRGMEVLMTALTAWILYKFVLKSLLRDKKLSFDGMFFLACFFLVLQEPWHSWIRPQLLYNDIFINYGSWMGSLPVSSPTAHKTPLPLAFAGLGYFWIVGGPAYCGSRLMGWGRARNPDISSLRLVGLCFLGFCIFDVIIESFIVRTGMFIYPSTIPWLTLFAGKTYQLPIYETASWAGTYTMLAGVHFFRNDKGETWADRNFDSLKMPASFKKFGRWLAIMGMCQAGMLFTYNIPYMYWALYGGKFTVTEQAYPWLTAGICGPSTAYDCPGPGVPIARRDMATNRISVTPP